MDLARKIHKCLTNGSDSHKLLDLFRKVKDKNMLAEINEYFLEHYDSTPHEFISEKFKVNEVYAIDSTLKYIREPKKKTLKARNGFYEKIGYSISTKKKKSK